MRQRFEEVILSRTRLRQVIPAPGDKVSHKQIDHLDDICRRFIAASPFVLVASRGADGLLDLSPKGDAPGFAAVLDERTLAIPDRLGNNRADTFENLLVHPEVALIFLVPGNGDTLRVSGRGRVVLDAALQRRFEVRGRAPRAVLVIDVCEAFMHCAKSVRRSGLWDPQAWPDRSAVPSLGEAMVKHGELPISVQEMSEIIVRDGETRLY